VNRWTLALSPAFFGPRQGGIATPQQTHSYFAAFDSVAKSRDELVTMLRLWTDAAARMSAGETARDLGQDLSVEGTDGGSALGLPPRRLTLTFGFGAGLFVKDGADRYA
jgi:deferrochelatase/peroxidase EfeB